MKLISEEVVQPAAPILVTRYQPGLREVWDGFVRDSKNGTFLFLRDYMDYHQDRFEDCSLLVWWDAEPIALLPANWDGRTIWSHQGLTYGGFVTNARMTTPRLLASFNAALDFLRGEGATELVYKTVPHIYHRLPAEEDLYALFRAGAQLYRRDVLSVLRRADPGPVQARRLRGARRAERAGVHITESEAWDEFWVLLTRRLLERYGRPPVHTLDEMRLLRSRFPENIRLFVALHQGAIAGGVVMYVSPQVAHVQYMAATDCGLALGVLDLVHLHLLEHVFPAIRYYDFGISNEAEGQYLNVGLIEQKEGFGARGVAHDFYRLAL